MGVCDSSTTKLKKKYSQNSAFQDIITENNEEPKIITDLIQSPEKYNEKFLGLKLSKEELENNNKTSTKKYAYVPHKSNIKNQSISHTTLTKKILQGFQNNLKEEGLYNNFTSKLIQENKKKKIGEKNIARKNSTGNPNNNKIIESENQYKEIIDKNIDDIFILNKNFEKSYNINNCLIYVINKDKEDNSCYSTEQEYSETIKNKINDRLTLSVELLKLNERKWYQELKDLNNILIQKRETLNDLNFCPYIRRVVKIYEHFNWIISSLTYYFNALFYDGSKNYIFKDDSISLPNVNDDNWFKTGFIWKNIYIKLIPLEKSKNIIKEVKALNYFFFDYLQIIDKYQTNIDNLLSNYIIFPLIGYAEINSYILFCSVVININENNIDYELINEIISENNGIINYKENNELYHNKYFNQFNINNNIFSFSNKYSIEDLINSRLFYEIKMNNLFPIDTNKFLLINVYNLIPNLFENKFEDFYKINFYSEYKKQKLYYTLDYNKKLNYKNLSENNEDYISYYKQNPLDILNNLFNIDLKVPYRIKDLIIKNVHFKIIYTSLSESSKNYKTKTFIDYLYHEGDKDQNQKLYINEPYVILYDLDDPIKLKYSLIKSIKSIKDQKREICTSIYFLRTNYIAYFMSWCKMMNKNSFNIKTYSDLKNNIKKYGISTNLLFFAIPIIQNEEILDIIKISLLVKALKFIFNKIEIININIKTNEINNMTLSDFRKKNIVYFIKSILYPNELLPIKNELFDKIYAYLVYFVNIIFLKLKLIDDYLCLGLLNLNKNNEKISNNYNIKESINNISGFESPKNFLKHIIGIARKKPFLFISELEIKLGFILNPFIKFKSSLSIESMSKKIEPMYIQLNNNGSKVYNYIKSNEISGFVLSKIIYGNESFHIMNSYNYSFNNNDINPNIDDDTNDDEIKIEFREKQAINKNTENHILQNYRINMKCYPPLRNGGMNIINKNNNLISNKGNEKSLLSKMNLFQNKENQIKLKTNFIKEIPSKPNNPNIINENYSAFDKTSIITNSTVASNYKINLSDICNDFFIELPPICYKANYSFEDNMDISLKNLSLYRYLKNEYTILNDDVLKEWNENNNSIFKNINSCNGEIEMSLLKAKVYLLVVNFFIKKDYKEVKEIITRIKKIYRLGGYQLSLQYLAIINLFQALCSEKYIESEEPYSKAVFLILLAYGDPRGRYNDGHGALQFPLWKIARKTFKLEQPIINENFKEMYQSLEYFEKLKCSLYTYDKLGYNNNFDYLNNAYNNLDKVLTLNGKSRCLEKSQISTDSMYFIEANVDERPDFNFLNNNLTDKDISLSLSIFDISRIEKKCIKHFNFPSISGKTENLDKVFFRKEFIVYIIKELQSLIYSNNIIYDEKYIDRYISEDIFDPYEENLNYTNSKVNINVYPKDDYLNMEAFLVSNFQEFEVVEKKQDKNKRNTTSCVNTNKNPNNIGRKTSEAKQGFYSGSTNIRPQTGNKQKSRSVFSHYLYEELLKKLSYKENIPSGTVISFGNNSHNETSHDRYEKITLPRVVFKLKNIVVDHIFSGWEHNIIISNKGEIFSFGHNQSFQCGLPNKDISYSNINDPTNVSIINNNIKAISASCGNEHSIILSDKNEVYAFGSNEDGVLGIDGNDLKTYKFNKINFGENTNQIISISAGTVHNLALTKNGNVYSWGSSQGGQLGFSEEFLLKHPGFKETYYISTPTLINQFNKKNSKMGIATKISCGEAHSLVLTEDGKVYSWGFGSNGQLGLGFCEDTFEPGTGLMKSRRFTPQKINISRDLEEGEEDDIIKDIKCGKTFSMFINDKKELFACGVNDLNQLGIQEPPPKNTCFSKDIQCYDFVFPTKLDYFLNMKVENISCGEGHCLAIIKDMSSNFQTIWSWGNNKFGQLGQGAMIKISLPKPVNYLLEYNSKKFDEISCGGFHSLCLVKHKSNLEWIDNDYYNTIINLIDEIGII